jgi:hypothetical protein
MKTQPNNDRDTLPEAGMPSRPAEVPREETLELDLLEEFEEGRTSERIYATIVLHPR